METGDEPLREVPRSGRIGAGSRSSPIDPSTCDTLSSSVAVVHQSHVQFHWIDWEDLGIPVPVDLDDCGDASISEHRHTIEQLLVRIHDIHTRRLGAVVLRSGRIRA